MFDIAEADLREAFDRHGHVLSAKVLSCVFGLRV
jgi:hypothetical protein